MKASKGSTVHLGEGNQRAGKDLGKLIESDKTSVIKFPL